MKHPRTAHRLWAAPRWLLIICALALAWAVADQPWQPPAGGGFIRLDALGAWFVLLAALALALADGGQPLRPLLALLPLLVAFASANTALLVLGYALFALLSAPLPPRLRPAHLLVQRSLPPALLGLGWALLALEGGGSRYDAPLAGGALNSWTFGCLLLAALLGSQPLLLAALPRWLAEAAARSAAPSRPQRAGPPRPADLWAVVWLYPLLRLYSIGPWNAGWGFAALLLGCAVALWCAAHAAAPLPEVPRNSAASGALVAVALACVGLGSAAGVAACCLALLCALLVAVGLGPAARTPRNAVSLWLLSGALPITLPFVAVWLAVGAATAGGVLVAAGAFWLVGLGNALATLRLLAAERIAGEMAGKGQHAPRRAFRGKGHDRHRVAPTLARPRPRVRPALAAASLLLGIAAPAFVQWPILPVARQLQGGLSPYGDLAIWPWVGLAAVTAGRQPVATLPSGALAGLMLVLCALAWLLARLLLHEER